MRISLQAAFSSGTGLLRRCALRLRRLLQPCLDPLGAWQREVALLLRLTSKSDASRGDASIPMSRVMVMTNAINRVAIASARSTSFTDLLRFAGRSSQDQTLLLLFENGTACGAGRNTSIVGLAWRLLDDPPCNVSLGRRRFLQRSDSFPSPPRGGCADTRIESPRLGAKVWIVSIVRRHDP